MGIEFFREFIHDNLPIATMLVMFNIVTLTVGCQHEWDRLLMERIGCFGELPELLIV